MPRRAARWKDPSPRPRWCARVGWRGHGFVQYACTGGRLRVAACFGIRIQIDVGKRRGFAVGRVRAFELFAGIKPEAEAMAATFSAAVAADR